MANPAKAAPQTMSRCANGWWAKVLYQVHRLMHGVSGGRFDLHIHLICAQPVGHGLFSKLRDSPGSLVRTVNRQDPIIKRFPRTAEVNDRRFSANASCHVVTFNDDFAGHLWLARGAYDEDVVRCRYELPVVPRCVWDFDVYVEPRFRNTRTMARLWKAVDADLLRQGVTWSFSRMSLFNAASIQAHERLGAVKVATTVFVILGPLQLTLYSRAPFVHLGTRAAHRPCLNLSAPREKSLDTPGSGRIAAGGGPAALVLGLDSHGLAVARAIADARVPVYALCEDAQMPGDLTNRARRTFRAASLTDDRMLPALLAARRELAGHSEVALLAINDKQVEVIARHLDELRPHYRIAWANGAKVILQLQRKDALEARCVQQGLRYPRSIIFERPAQARDAADFRFPVIIKPVKPLSSFKTLLAPDVATLEQLLNDQVHDLPILGQEYVEGDDRQIYFGALMLDRGRVIHGMAGRKIASYPPARGQTTIAETVDAPEVLLLTEQFFAGLELTGPVSLEVKRDTTGHYWVIEPTVGRTDFWAELCIRAGFNQPLMEFELAVGLPVTAADAPRNCVWYDTERDPLAYASLCWHEKTISPCGKTQAFPYHGNRDWRPFFEATRRMLAGRLYQLWQR